MVLVGPSARFKDWGLQFERFLAEVERPDLDRLSIEDCYRQRHLDLLGIARTISRAPRRRTTRPLSFGEVLLRYTDENMCRLSLYACRSHSTTPAAVHSPYVLHLNNVIAKRLGISAGD